MPADSHTIYTEVQKLNVKKWILIPMLIALAICVLILAVPMTYFFIKNGAASIAEIFPTPMILFISIGAFVPCVIMFIVRKRMKLELLVNKEGLNYKYLVFSAKDRFVEWDEVSSIEIKKYPYAASRPGEQNRLYTKGQEAIVMTVDMIGMDLIRKNGQKIFITLNDPDEFIKAIRKLELNIQILK